MIYGGPNWFLSRPFHIILSLCTKMTHFKTIWPDFCIFIYIIYIYIHNLHIHAPHAHICTTQKMYGYMQNNKYMCHIHYQKHIWRLMHHIHIHAPPRTYVRIHAPHTHTCTTYTYMHHQIPPENKICLVDLTSVLYERPNQNERFLLNNMFLVLFSEMCSAFQWNAQFMKCAVHFTEMCISLKCAVKCTAHFSEMCSAFHWNVHFTEMHSEMCSTFHWNAQCISVKCTVKCTTRWTVLHFSEKRSTFHCAFQQYFMSFWVPTKYRSFIRKTNNSTR